MHLITTYPIIIILFTTYGASFLVSSARYLLSS